MTTIIPPEDHVYLIKNVGLPDTVLLQLSELSDKLANLHGRPRGTQPGESVAHCADGSPLPVGANSSSLPYASIIYSANGKWKAIAMIYQGAIDEEDAAPPEEKKLTGPERAALAVFEAQTQELPADWDDPEAP